MVLEKSLEETTEIRPILNPRGPNKQETEELIEILSTVLDDPTASPGVKDYTVEMIKAVKKGYEIQSEQVYDGFWPENLNYFL